MGLFASGEAGRSLLFEGIEEINDFPVIIDHSLGHPPLSSQRTDLNPCPGLRRLPITFSSVCVTVTRLNATLHEEAQFAYSEIDGLR